ncbi:hypothetical protein Scep_005217 [Stephania cephalantha]|uniref:Uncharacterized protein n=1 Tax=Stephania cephalantha TaxID=152367 RepID=A0AAP0KVB0_9MAGN
MRRRRWCGLEELLVRTPAEQRGSSSSGPAGWSDGMCGRRPADARTDRMDSAPARGSGSGEPATRTTSSGSGAVNDVEQRRGGGCNDAAAVARNEEERKKRKGGSLFGEPKSWS